MLGYGEFGSLKFKNSLHSASFRQVKVDETISLGGSTWSPREIFMLGMDVVFSRTNES